MEADRLWSLSELMDARNPIAPKSASEQTKHNGASMIRMVERHAALLSAATLVRAQAKPAIQGGMTVPLAAWRILLSVLDGIEGVES